MKLSLSDAMMITTMTTHVNQYSEWCKHVGVGVANDITKLKL